MGKFKNPKNKDREFWDSARLNNLTAQYYYDRLTELAISMFEWENIPDTIDPRFLELTLFGYGQAVFFYDDVLGYLALNSATWGGFNVYRIPLRRRAYASNGYNKGLNIDNSVIIYNNMLRKNSALTVELYANRLAELDRTIDVNIKAQKTPVFIQCPETQRLTMENLYMKYDGNQPFIFGDKTFDPNSIKAFKTDAPYVADKIFTLKTMLWNECLTHLGISNINVMKKERLISDEVQRNQGAVIASRYSRLEARKQACREINKMFGLNIDVKYREDVREFTEDYIEVINNGGDSNE